MPIYEYQCAECAHKMEALRKISDEPLLDCPACGKPALNKLVSAASFRLKGSGWYETDFKTGNQKNLAGDGKEKNSSGEKSASGKGEGGTKTTSESSSGSSGEGKKSSGQSGSKTT